MISENEHTQIGHLFFPHFEVNRFHSNSDKACKYDFFFWLTVNLSDLTFVHCRIKKSFFQLQSFFFL